MVTELFNAEDMSRSLNARFISFSRQNDISSVSIDSREIKEGGIFFALSGSKSDGHCFVAEAFSRGARAAVVEASKLEKFKLACAAQELGKNLIVVDNTLKSLQDTAGIYLDKFPSLLKIGITGSSGKTTTKEIAYAIISSEKNTVKNEGNLNSETGLPLSAFEVRSHHEVGIFELGMNRPGEISEIAGVLRPDIALVTNIGSSHIEFFGSREKIVNEKKCIYKFLSNGGIALVPENDEYAKQLSDNVNASVKFFSERNFNEFDGSRGLGLDGTEIIWAGEKIRFSLAGKHCLDDAIAAIAIAKEVPVSDKAIKRGLESVKPLFGRQEILRGFTTVIRDCYNANPESAAKAVEFCDSLEWPAGKVYVIADMLELGETSEAEHEKLGFLLSASSAKKIFLYGEKTEAAARGLSGNGKQFFHTRDIDEMARALDSFIVKGDLVLLKGSRGCALERLTGTLLKTGGAPAKECGGGNVL